MADDTEQPTDQIDVITAAKFFRDQLEAIMQTNSLREVRAIARRALHFALAEPGELTLSSEPAIAMDTLSPYVNLIMTAPAMQVTVDQAKAIADMIRETAEQAESEHFVLSFFVNDVGVDLEHTVRMLAAFRRFRRGQAHVASSA